jgi:hypothetical protein
MGRGKKKRKRSWAAGLVGPKKGKERRVGRMEKKKGRRKKGWAERKERKEERELRVGFRTLNF